MMLRPGVAANRVPTERVVCPVFVLFSCQSASVAVRVQVDNDLVCYFCICVCFDRRAWCHNVLVRSGEVALPGCQTDLASRLC
jgi:hypothetical protein